MLHAVHQENCTILNIKISVFFLLFDSPQYFIEAAQASLSERQSPTPSFDFFLKNFV